MCETYCPGSSITAAGRQTGQCAMAKAETEMVRDGEVPEERADRPREGDKSLTGDSLSSL